MKAINIIPYHYAQRCSFDDGETSFMNEVVGRRWSEDGTGKIWFMLESHNFFSAFPDEEVEFIEPYEGGYPEESRKRAKERDDHFMSQWPDRTG